MRAREDSENLGSLCNLDSKIFPLVRPHYVRAARLAKKLVQRQPRENDRVSTALIFSKQPLLLKELLLFGWLGGIGPHEIKRKRHLVGLIKPQGFLVDRARNRRNVVQQVGRTRLRVTRNTTVNAENLLVHDGGQRHPIKARINRLPDGQTNALARKRDTLRLEGSVFVQLHVAIDVTKLVVPAEQHNFFRV